MRTTLLLLIAFQWTGLAEDWPTYQHDNRRSAVTKEALALPLKESWRYESPSPPQTAWTGPAKWDAYSGNDGLQSMRNFDPAFYVTAVADSVYFGSSVDNSAHCLDATNGESRWQHYTNSAVRLPPTIGGDKAWFGSDDGHVYCVQTSSGELVWKSKPSPDPRLIPSNGKLISLWPVRSGVLLQNGVAYFGASLMPWEPSFLCAVDAGTGSQGDLGRFVMKETGITLQGALLASKENLYAPQGRSVPLVYRIADGKRLGGIAGSGGVYCVLTEDEQLISMPANQKEKSDTVRIADGKNRETLVSFGGADRMIVSGPYAYSHQGNRLKVIDRFKIVALQAEINVLADANDKRSKAMDKAKKAKDKARMAELKEEITVAKKAIAEIEARKPSCELWSKEYSIPIGFMLANEHLFVGGQDSVATFHAKTGEKLWEAKVDGKAYGLAAANGRLFISTDTGAIYCFQ